MGRGIVALVALAFWGCGDGEKGVDLETRLELEQCRAELREARETFLALTEPEPSGLGAVAGEPAEDQEPPPNDEDAPLVPLRTIVRRNSAGTSEITLALRNRGDKTINAFRFTTELYNGFNERIHSDDFRAGRAGIVDFRGVSNDARMRPGQERRLGSWSAFDHDGAVKGITTVYQVHFADNTTWEGHIRQEHDPREPEEDRPARRPPRRPSGGESEMDDGPDISEFLDVCAVAPNSDRCLEQRN